jgi:hypothetical protein
VVVICENCSAGCEDLTRARGRHRAQARHSGASWRRGHTSCAVSLRWARSPHAFFHLSCGWVGSSSNDL